MPHMSHGNSRAVALVAANDHRLTMWSVAAQELLHSAAISGSAGMNSQTTFSLASCARLGGLCLPWITTSVMSTYRMQFVVRDVALGFPPTGWACCDRVGSMEAAPCN